VCVQIKGKSFNTAAGINSEFMIASSPAGHVPPPLEGGEPGVSGEV